MRLLSVENVSVRYGKIAAVRNLRMHVDNGEIVTLIGGNGAGKSTTMKTISGLLKHYEGAIEFDGQSINQVPGHKRVRRGIVHVPEGREVFGPLTVEENLLMGAYLQNDKREIKEGKEKVFHLFPRLKERIHQQAGTLSGGEQQMLAIGRALMAKPRLLMLDEPSLGLSPLIVQEIFVIIEALNLDGTTTLLVEQNARLGLSISSRGYVMETGSILLGGDSKALLQDERVQKAYLGA